MVYGFGSGKEGDFFFIVGKIVEEIGMVDGSFYFLMLERSSDGIVK